MGLSWQQGPLAPGAIGRFLVPDPLPDRLLFAEPLRRRTRVRFGGVRGGPLPCACRGGYGGAAVRAVRVLRRRLHASIRENERRARLAGNQQAATYWTEREEQFREILHRANRAALEYMQAWAGVTRTGYHSPGI